ncbi:MAG TPA: AAA family ATPase, partial [Ktedonobacteraceae bacterium]|nr:AAA family ATPase [Ktedonobacteraceae bacterium]
MDFKEINNHFKQVNQDISGLNKALKQQQKEDKQKFNDSTLTLLKLMSEEMQSHNASEQSIQLAIKGTYEFYKVLAKAQLPQSRINSLLHHENQAQQSTSSFGTPLSEIETQHITWLWENRIPQGKITLLEGDPGMGKSLLAIDIAAHVSTGRPMPGERTGKIGSVILIAPEDSAADTIKPRAAAAGGDLSRIHILSTLEDLNVNDVKKLKFYQKPFSLAKNLFELEQAIIQTKAILVILDPLTAVLGHNIDSSRDQGIREIFTPLALLAESTNCAFLVVRHLKKGSSDNLLYRGAGSIGIIAAARTCLTIFYDPADEKKRVLAVTKSNLVEPPKNLSYQIVPIESIAPHIQWHGEINLDVSTLFGPGINLSFPRQEIINALQSSSRSLELKEIAEKTGLNYKTLRMTLSRMHEAGLIAHPYRGMYTTLEHYAESKKRIEERVKARELEDEA